MNNTVLIFKEIDGMWTQVNTSAGDSARTLADTLRSLDIIIDDNTQFCRIIRNYETFYEIITYRAYNNAKITITKNTYKNE